MFCNDFSTTLRIRVHPKIWILKLCEKRNFLWWKKTFALICSKTLIFEKWLKCKGEITRVKELNIRKDDDNFLFIFYFFKSVWLMDTIESLSFSFEGKRQSWVFLLEFSLHFFASYFHSYLKRVAYIAVLTYHVPFPFIAL